MSTESAEPKADQTEFDETAMKLVFENASDFLSGGIELLFSKAADRRKAKIAMVSIQTSMELLAKFRLVEALGFDKLVDGRPPADLASVRSGACRSITYRRALQALEDVEGISPLDKELFDEAAAISNKLIHFAGDLDLPEIRVTSAHLAVRALDRFASAGWRDAGEFANHGRLLRGAALKILTSFEPYRSEAVDSALDDPETVLRCWECKADALSLRVSETYFCHCCGLSAQSDVAAFADCRFCKAKKGVVYDPLNRSPKGHDGKCLHCDVRQWVSRRSF